MSKAIPKYLARCNIRFDKESEDFLCSVYVYGHTIIVFGFGQ